MGNSVSNCKELNKFSDCLNSDEVDFKLIDVKKKFINSKYFNRNEMDHKFYKKIVSDKSTHLVYSASKSYYEKIPKENVLNLDNKDFDKIKNKIHASQIGKQNVLIYKSRFSAGINQTLGDSTNTLGVSTKKFVPQINSKCINNNQNRKKEYYNGRIKVVLFSDKNSLRNVINEMEN